MKAKSRPMRKPGRHTWSGAGDDRQLGGGGGNICIFMFTDSKQSISKEINNTENDAMKISLLIIDLSRPLHAALTCAPLSMHIDIYTRKNKVTFIHPVQPTELT